MSRRAIKRMLTNAPWQYGLTVGAHNGKPFIIVEGWSYIEKITKQVNRLDYEPKFGDVEDGLDFDAILEIAFGKGVDWGFADQFEFCGPCGRLLETQFDFNSHLYELSGDTMCIKCQREYIIENLEQCSHDYIPTRDSAIQNYNVGSLPKDPRIKEVTVETGSASWGLAPQIDKDAIIDAIEQIVKRGKRWLCITSNASSDVRVMSATIYEVDLND